MFARAYAEGACNVVVRVQKEQLLGSVVVIRLNGWGITMQDVECDSYSRMKTVSLRTRAGCQAGI